TPALGGEDGDGQHAAHAVIERWPVPGIAEAVFGDDLLEAPPEVRGIAQRILRTCLAAHLPPQREPRFLQLAVHLTPPRVKPPPRAARRMPANCRCSRPRPRGRRPCARAPA